MANNIVILVRGDTAEHWEEKDSLLKLREIGYDQTNRRFKVGDGVNTWKTLPYVKPDVIDDLITGGADAALSAEQGKVLSGLIGDCADDIDTINQNITNLEKKIEGTNITVEDSLTSDSTTSALSAKQGKALKALIDAKKAYDGLDNQNPNAFLSANQGYVLNSKIPSVVDTLTSTSTTSALSAKQGKELKALVDGKTSVTVINSLTSTSTTNALSAKQGKVLNDKLSAYSTESWTFTLSTGSTITKKVVLSS